jgi:hypothetical protein
MGVYSTLPIDYVKDAIVADSIVSEGIQRRGQALDIP